MTRQRRPWEPERWTKAWWLGLLGTSVPDGFLGRWPECEVCGHRLLHGFDGHEWYCLPCESERFPRRKKNLMPRPRVKYTFSHRSDDGLTYYWQGPRLPGDSRSEMVSCPVAWFWRTP